MAPFPETEIMTLKRLEVALKKGDFKLLKDGTYKLHEKYHSGFKFEYIDLLKDILYNTNNSNVPPDIKDILIPTLEDILSISKTPAPTTTSPYESLNPNKVSSLTSLGYMHRQKQVENQAENQTENQNIEETKEEKISAFDVFASPKNTSYIHQKQEIKYDNQQNENNQQIATGDIIVNENESESESETFEEFSLPKVDPIEIDEPVSGFSASIQQQAQSAIQNETKTSSVALDTVQSEIKTKTVSIFYFQNNSDDKNKNIKKYKEAVSKIPDEKVDFSEIMKLISSINTQSNANVSELGNIFEQIQNRNVKINLITNSTNSNIVGLIESIKIPYKFNSTEEKINIVPLFGLTNMFKCTQCSEEYIDLKDDITPYVIQCPKCKSPMLPNFSCIETKINLNCYNSSIINAASSDIWLILYPFAAESSMLEIMKSALILNRNVKNIYIADKDINAKETCKNAFCAINKDIKVNIDVNVMEEFLKTV